MNNAGAVMKKWSLMKKAAVMDEVYRYSLLRAWGDRADHLVCFIMLNPSTADAEQDDPTIRRCIGLAKAWGMDGIEVVNLYAYRATDPKQLGLVPDPEGPANLFYVDQALARAHWVIAAWGANKHAHYDHLKASLYAAVHESKLFCLGLTKHGAPRHPLYVKQTVKLRGYAPEDIF